MERYNGTAWNWKLVRRKHDYTIAVAYLGYGRYGTCHGRNFDGGRKNCLAKIKIFIFTASWNSILRPIQTQTVKLHQHSAPVSDVLGRECCVSTITYYGKTAVLWQNTTVRRDGTRTIACHVCKTSSFQGCQFSGFPLDLADFNPV